MPGRRRVFASTPFLIVRDVKVSAAFYEKVLGRARDPEETMAYVRVGQFKARPDEADELCRIYESEAIPTIRAASGNISAVLLRQHQERDTFLAITIWRTGADAEAYDKSGLAQQMVNKIRHAFAGPPTLTTWETYGI
jgi:quinol monooxygenase YgiN